MQLRATRKTSALVPKRKGRSRSLHHSWIPKMFGFPKSTFPIVAPLSLMLHSSPGDVSLAQHCRGESSSSLAAPSEHSTPTELCQALPPIPNQHNPRQPAQHSLLSPRAALISPRAFLIRTPSIKAAPGTGSCDSRCPDNPAIDPLSQGQPKLPTRFDILFQAPDAVSPMIRCCVPTKNVFNKLASKEPYVFSQLHCLKPKCSQLQFAELDLGIQPGPAHSQLFSLRAESISLLLTKAL